MIYLFINFNLTFLITPQKSIVPLLQLIESNTIRMMRAIETIAIKIAKQHIPTPQPHVIN